MKSKKAKIEKKPAKKSEKRVAKKELEISITDKFLDVIRSFGQEAGNFTKDVKKLSKSLAKKLADKVSSMNGSENAEKTGKTRAAATEPAVKRAVKAPKRTLTKAEKVVARAATTSAVRKKPASAVKVASPPKVSVPKTTAAKTAKPGTAKNSRDTALKAQQAAAEKQVPAVKSPSKMRRSGTQATPPVARKPRVQQASPENAPPAGGINQPVTTDSDLDRTNNSDMM